MQHKRKSLQKTTGMQIASDTINTKSMSNTFPRLINPNLMKVTGDEDQRVALKETRQGSKLFRGSNVLFSDEDVQMLESNHRSEYHLSKSQLVMIKARENEVIKAPEKRYIYSSDYIDEDEMLHTDQSEDNYFSPDFSESDDAIPEEYEYVNDPEDELKPHELKCMIKNIIMEKRQKHAIHATNIKSCNIKRIGDRHQQVELRTNKFSKQLMNIVELSSDVRHERPIPLETIIDADESETIYQMKHYLNKEDQKIPNYIFSVSETPKRE